MKTILITGGAGFLGSHLSEKLLNENNKVIVADNLQTGSKENISGLLKNNNFTFIEHDIIDVLNTSEKIDEIYNLACPASPPHYQKDPIRTMKTSTIGVLNMLELARRNNAKIFQASTSEVYGDPNITPQNEDYRGNVSTIGPRACYDEGKRCAESLFFDYHRTYGTKIKVVRIFNTYGPQMAENDGRVVSNFILQALKNEPITVYGKGEQTRSFCYVEDLIRGFVLMMDSDDSIKGPLNLGNPSEITVLELANKIIELTGSKSKIVYEKLPEDDPTQRCPDITKAKKMINWFPEVTLEEGLRKTISYFRHRI